MHLDFAGRCSPRVSDITGRTPSAFFDLSLGRLSAHSVLDDWIADRVEWEQERLYAQPHRQVSEWNQIVEHLRSAQSVTFWASIEPSEQYALLWAARWLPTLRGDDFTLAYVDAPAWEPPETAAKRVRRLGPDEVSTLAQYWDFLTGARAEAPPALPEFLIVPKYRRLFLPYVEDGLTPIERSILDWIPYTEDCHDQLGEVMLNYAGPLAKYVGLPQLRDALLHLTHSGLSEAPFCALRVERDFESTSFTLTELGRAIREGKAAFDTHCGLDRWVEGCHYAHGDRPLHYQTATGVLVEVRASRVKPTRFQAVEEFELTGWPRPLDTNTPDPDIVLVAAGYTTAATLQESGASGRIVMIPDGLEEGPCGDSHDAERWIAERLTWPSFGAIWLERLGRAWQNLLEAARDASELRVYAADCLREQLALLWAYRFLPRRALRLLYLPTPQGPRERGILVGTDAMNPQQLRDGERLDVLEEPGAHDLLIAAWSAVSARTPERLAELIKGPLPAWLAGLPMLMRRFPHPLTGFDFYESAMLQFIVERPNRRGALIVGTIVGATSGKSDSIGDVHIFDRIVALTRDPRPALTAEGDLLTMRSTSFCITPFGEACLRGETNYFVANRRELSVAGTRLSVERDSLWWWDGEALTSGRP